MSQHSWYDKNRRHYGRKPNTRKARGLKRRDAGKKRGCLAKKPICTMQAVEADQNAEAVKLPDQLATMKRYARIYNWYVQHFDKYPDKRLCFRATVDKFGLSEPTVRRAIAVCKYLLATS